MYWCILTSRSRQLEQVGKVWKVQIVCLFCPHWKIRDSVAADSSPVCCQDEDHNAASLRKAPTTSSVLSSTTSRTTSCRSTVAATFDIQQKMFRLYNKKLAKLCAWYSSDEEWPCSDEDLEKARPFRDGSKNLVQKGSRRIKNHNRSNGFSWNGPQDMISHLFQKSEILHQHDASKVRNCGRQDWISSLALCLIFFNHVLNFKCTL